MWTRFNDIDRMLTAMELFRSRMNRMMSGYDASYGDDYGLNVVNGSPRTNLYDNGDSLQMIAEVPGLSKDDLSIRIQGNYLELSGTRKSDAPEGYKAHRTERPAVTFSRSFTLPADVDSDKIEAVLTDGILSLVLPKAEAAKPKQITIS
jgi:HSP20 family protein